MIVRPPINVARARAMKQKTAVGSIANGTLRSKSFLPVYWPARGHDVLLHILRSIRAVAYVSRAVDLVNLASPTGSAAICCTFINSNKNRNNFSRWKKTRAPGMVNGRLCVFEHNVHCPTAK